MHQFSPKKYRRRFVTIPIIWLVLSLLAGCSLDFAAMGESRISYARKFTTEINIVAIRDQEEGDFIRGIQLAAEQINLRPEKLLNKQVNIIVEQGSSSIEDAKYLIQKNVSNPTVTAVIGHRSSSVALPASVIYEESKLVFITPFSTAKSLTGHGFKYVFRMAPNNAVMTAQLSNLSRMLGHKRIVILYARDDFSREMAFMYEDAALKQKMTLVKRASFFSNATNYRPIISQFNEEQFDAIFLAAGAQASGVMAQQLREMGVDVPIIGTDALNSETYHRLAGDAANKSFFPSLYVENEDDLQGPQQTFIKNYSSRYGKKPDYNAAQGYDSLMLLAAGIKRANSVIPSLLSSTLHYLPAWAGATGLHAFDQSGELLGKRYTFNVWIDGKKVPLPVVHNRFLLERFQSSLEKTDDKRTDFSEVFSTSMHEEDQQIYMLDLAQELLDFKTIGVIYEDTDAGRKLSGYQLAEDLAKRKALKIVGCRIPYSLMTATEIATELTSCYGTLSLEIDVMLMPRLPEVDHQLLRFLNESLTSAKIPSIALTRQLSDTHFALTLNKRKPLKSNSSSIFTPLLKGIEFYEFADKIINLPEITFNLEALRQIGVDEKGILNLSPDFLITGSDTDQQDGF